MAGREGDVAGVGAAGGEDPVVPFRRRLPGPVGVRGHHRVDAGARAADLEVGRQRVGLSVGQGGAERGDTDVTAVARAGQGHGEGVQRAFDDDRGGSGGEPVGVSRRARRAGHPWRTGRSRRCSGTSGRPWPNRRRPSSSVVVVGVTAADETDHPQRRTGVCSCIRVRPAVGMPRDGGVDGQDEPVAEGVDEPAGGGLLG